MSTTPVQEGNPPPGLPPPIEPAIQIENQEELEEAEASQNLENLGTAVEIIQVRGDHHERRIMDLNEFKKLPLQQETEVTRNQNRRRRRSASKDSKPPSNQSSCNTSPGHTPPSRRRIKPAIKDLITGNIWAQSGNIYQHRQEKYGEQWVDYTKQVEKERALIDLSTPATSPLKGAAQTSAEVLNQFTNPGGEVSMQNWNSLQGPIIQDPFKPVVPNQIQYPDFIGFTTGMLNSMNRKDYLMGKPNKSPDNVEELKQLTKRLALFDTISFRNQAITSRTREQQEYDLRNNLALDLYEELPVMNYFDGDLSLEQETERPKLLFNIGKKLGQTYSKAFTPNSSREEFHSFFKDLESATNMNRLRPKEVLGLLNERCDHKLRTLLGSLLRAKNNDSKRTLEDFMQRYGKPKQKESMLLRFNNMKLTKKSFRHDVQELRRLSMTAFEGEAEEAINNRVADRILSYLSDYINRIIARERQKRLLAVKNGLTTFLFEGEPLFEFIILTVEDQSSNPSVQILRFEEEDLENIEELILPTIPDVAQIQQQPVETFKEPETETKPNYSKNKGKGVKGKSKDTKTNVNATFDQKITFKDKKLIEEAVAALEERFQSKPFVETILFLYESGSKVFPNLKAPKMDENQKLSNTIIEGKYVLNTNSMPEHVFNRRKKNYFFTEAALKYFTNHCWRCGSTTCNPKSQHCPYRNMDTTFKPCNKCRRGLHKDKDCKRMT